jgi:predicted lipoprotein with Yx(FWY)xxD motif
MPRRIVATIALLSLLVIPSTFALAQDTSSGLVTTTDHPTLGSILADANGMTLYTWAGDTPGASACNDACARAWPPYLVDEGTAMNMMGMSSGLGAIQRNDGSYQAALDGWPLYRFSGDSQPGSANGEGSTGFGARWSAAKADSLMM